MTFVSTTEILDELPRLSLADLQLVHERILELESEREIDPSAAMNEAIEEGLRSMETEPTFSVEETRIQFAQWFGKSA